MTTPHLMPLETAGCLGKGTVGLSGTLLRGDHNKGSPPGKSIWLPPGHFGGVTPSRRSSPETRADHGAAITWAPGLLCTCPGDSMLELPSQPDGFAPC